MIRTQVYLSEGNVARLRRLVATTGKTQSELIREAVDRLDLPAPDRITALRSARGRWAERDDLPDFEAIRREADDRLVRLFEEDV